MRKNPGPVMYSILDDALRRNCMSFATQLRVPCLSVLDPFVEQLAPYLKSK